MSTMLVGVVACSAAVASAQTTLLEENFDSYADTAALNAVWTQESAGYTLMTDGGHSGNNYVQTGTAAAGKFYHAIDVTPTDDSPVEVSFWARVPSTTSGRSYLQLDISSAFSYVAFGQYNSPGGGKWNYRLGGGETSGWQASSADQVADTWTHLKVIAETRRVRYYVDDVQVAEETRTSDFAPLTNIRFGFTGSSAITVDYDDVLVRQVSGVNDWNLY